MTVNIPIYLQLSSNRNVALSMNWYRNAHYFEKAKAKSLMAELLIPQFEPIFINTHICIDYKFYYKNPTSDLMNFCSLASKWLLDSLQTAGVIPNDNVRYVIEENCSVACQDKVNPRIEAHIYQRTPQ